MTGAEATLLAGLVGGGSAVLAAGLATFGTYKVTNRSIAAQARSEGQERLTEMYTDLMYLLHSVMASVEATRARVRLSNRVIPSSLSPAEQSRIGARVETLAAESIRRRLPPWQSKVLMFNIGVGQLDESRVNRRGGVREITQRLNGQRSGATWIRTVSSSGHRRKSLRTSSGPNCPQTPSSHQLVGVPVARPYLHPALQELPPSDPRHGLKAHGGTPHLRPGRHDHPPALALTGQRQRRRSGP